MDCLWYNSNYCTPCNNVASCKKGNVLLPRKKSCVYSVIFICKFGKNKQITEYQSREIEFIKEERLSINKIKNDQLEPTLKIIEEVFISINKTQTKINETIRKNEKQNEKDARNALKELNEKEKNFETEMKKVKESLDEIKNKLDEIITSDKMDYIKLLDTFINCNKNKVENEGTTEQA